MNKFLLAAAVAVLTPTTLLAADLPSRRAPPVYVPPMIAPAFTWTGMYAGLNAGYAFSGGSTYNLAATDLITQTLINNGTRPGFLKTSSKGFTGGGQIGYNFQLGGAGIPGFGGGGFVAGVEADAAYTGLSKTTDYLGTFLTDSNFHSRLAYLGTVRGRLGYAFGDLFVYGTGGFAYGNVNNAITYYPGAFGFYTGNSSSMRTGYAYGGGLEYAIPTSSFVNFFKSSAVTVKAEFIHYNLGTQSIAVPNAAGLNGGYIANIKTDGNLVRAGINYKVDLFGSPVAPVVARY